MNTVTLVGRAGRDAEIRYFESGKVRAQFSLAVNRWDAKTKSEVTDWFNIDVWDKQAENLARYQKKGNQIAVEGRIQTRNYDDNNGRRVYVTEILASNISFLDSRAASAGSGNFNSLPEPPIQEDVPVSTVSVEKDPFEAFGDSIEISDNDLPF